MMTLKEWLKLFKLLFKDISRFNPCKFYGMYICFFISSSSFILVLKLKELILDGALGLNQSFDNLWGLIYLLGLYLVLVISKTLVNQMGHYLGENYDFITRQVMEERILIQCNQRPPISFEDKEELDQMDKALQGARCGVDFLNSSMDLFFMYGPMYVFFTLYLMSFRWYLGLILLLILLPVLFNHKIQTTYQGTYEDQVAPYRRKIKAYGEAMVGLAAYKETQTLGLFSFFMDHYHTTYKLYKHKKGEILKQEVKLQVVSNGLILVAYIGILLILVYQLVLGHLSLGGFSAILFALDGLFSTFEEAIMGRLQSVAGSLGPIMNYYDYIREGKTDSKNKAIGRGGIELDNVSFSYPNHPTPVLDQISLTINQGETIAVVGKNGAGKTTLAKVLSGLYSPSSGQVIYDGAFERVSYDTFSQVFQGPKTYGISLRENIQMNQKSWHENHIKDLLKTYGLGQLRVTYDTVLGKRFGQVDLSGGQWQKLSLVRAMYRESPVLILDEPTSAVDPLEEGRLYQAFLEMSQDKTSIIITHRLALAPQVDRVLVIDQGRILGFDSHENLLNHLASYKDMWQAQAGMYGEFA